MKLSCGIATLALVLASSGIALAASGDSGGTTNGGAMAKPISYPLAALNGSGQHGTVTLESQGKNTLVTIAISGEPSGAVEPAHIHTGSCGPTLGAPKWALTKVENGKSSTVVPAAIAQVNASGLAVNLHESPTKIGNYVACGNIKP